MFFKPTSDPPDEAVLKSMLLYYRTPNPTPGKLAKPILKCLKVEDATMKEARQEALAYLNEQMVIFINPILILIKGGKK